MANWNFGEVIVKTYLQRKEDDEKQREFNQQMAFQNRQLSLLDQYRKDTLEQQDVHFDEQMERMKYEFGETTKLNKSNQQINKGICSTQ